MKRYEKLGMVPCTCNPTLGRQKQEDLQFEASLSYIVRPCPTLHLPSRPKGPHFKASECGRKKQIS
jgi:hypothetical protein